jgi:hypothetical protein
MPKRSAAFRGMARVCWSCHFRTVDVTNSRHTICCDIAAPMGQSKKEQLKIGNRKIEVSNLDKVLYPGGKFQKER